jgi:hypothetical protein
MNDYENTDTQDLSTTDQQEIKQLTEKATRELNSYIEIGKKDKQAKIFNKQNKEVKKS